ncbi:MAG: hypothetical protein ACLFUS_07575 [Candidatus Sumerlaeia bacterium]
MRALGCIVAAVAVPIVLILLAAGFFFFKIITPGVRVSDRGHNTYVRTSDGPSALVHRNDNAVVQMNEHGMIEILNGSNSLHVDGSTGKVHMQNGNKVMHIDGSSGHVYMNDGGHRNIHVSGNYNSPRGSVHISSHSARKSWFALGLIPIGGLGILLLGGIGLVIFLIVRRNNKPKPQYAGGPYGGLQEDPGPDMEEIRLQRERMEAQRELRRQAEQKKAGQRLSEEELEAEMEALRRQVEGRNS